MQLGIFTPDGKNTLNEDSFYFYFYINTIQNFNVSPIKI